MKIKEPIIKLLTPQNIYTSFKTNEFTNNLYIYNNEENIKIKDIEINSCHFKNFDFNKVKLENIEIYDCIFENCNLANLNLDYKLIHRTIFKNCTLIGTSFIDSSLKDIKFIESNLQYVNFSGSKLSNILFDNCNLNESSLIETNLGMPYIYLIYLAITKHFSEDLKKKGV